MDLQLGPRRRAVPHITRHLNWRKHKNECFGLSLREAGLYAMGIRSWMHTRRMSQLRPDRCRGFICPFGGGVTCLDLDKTEDRFLLAGAADTTIALYDTHTGSEQAQTRIGPISSSRRQTHPGGHKFMISSVAWYPVDTGLFVSGSYDCSVKVWDTNEFEVVCTFQLPKKVTGVAMSLVATAHTLAAASCEDTHVRLCDPTSGAVSHVFSGHRDAVWCVAWSTSSEFELLSGDGGGQIRLWDIRRSGCRAVLDQYCTQRPDRGPPTEDSLPPMSAAKKQRRGAAAGPIHPSASAPARLSSQAATATSSRMKETAVRAHSGAVTCVLPCPDAVSLITAGTDGRMRLWDATYRYNKLVSYEGTHNRALRARQLAITDDARVVFYPTGSSLNIYEVETGRTLATVQGAHTESINCCAYNPALHELYTGANDQLLRVWSVHSDPDGNEEENEED